MEEYLRKRKHLKKNAARRLGVPLDALGWVDGALVFLTSNLTVDGVPKVPKPNGESTVKAVASRPHWTERFGPHVPQRNKATQRTSARATARRW
jgi:hypothetical protein